MVGERPPAGRFAARLSPFVRGTLQKQNRTRRFCCLSVPLTKGGSRGAQRPAGGRDTPCLGSRIFRKEFHHVICEAIVEKLLKGPLELRTLDVPVIQRDPI